MSKSPWREDAAKGATHRTYEIRTVTDFFMVPVERRRICLREFHSWLAIQEGVTELLVAASGSMHKDDALKPSDLRWQNGVFRWIDDGEGCISVQMAVDPPGSEAPEEETR